jgi:hypothetical protein
MFVRDARETVARERTPAPRVTAWHNRGVIADINVAEEYARTSK